jgi:hypothetical protein
MWRAGRARIIVAFCLLLGIGAYYLWTLHLGARATAFARTDWRSTGFIIYEQLGFAGLGPGRTDLRMGGVGLLRPFAPALFAYAALVAVVAFQGARAMAVRLSCRRITSLVLAFAAPSILLLSVGMASHWRVLGRHCIVLMPGWVTLLGFGLAKLWRDPKCLGKAAAVAFLAMALWSCVLIRFAVRHERDDYRSAAQVARVALTRGAVVWWNAFGDGARYYHVPLAGAVPEAGKAELVMNLSPDLVASLEKPDLVAVSKPELFDVQGGVAAYLAQHSYHPVERFAAFTIWRP